MLNLIRSVPNFPKHGINFKDIFPLLESNFHGVIDDLDSAAKVIGCR